MDHNQHDCRTVPGVLLLIQSQYRINSLQLSSWKYLLHCSKVSKENSTNHTLLNKMSIVNKYSIIYKMSILNATLLAIHYSSNRSHSLISLFVAFFQFLLVSPHCQHSLAKAKFLLAEFYSIKVSWTFECCGYCTGNTTSYGRQVSILKNIHNYHTYSTYDCVTYWTE